MIYTVFVVGAGFGDPGLMTVRGRRALDRADVIIADRLVPPELLRARPGVEVIVFGPGGSEPPQDELARLLVDKARAGRRVVRLKGGAPSPLADDHAETDALHAAGVPCVIVPGVTAATRSWFESRPLLGRCILVLSTAEDGSAREPRNAIEHEIAERLDEAGLDLEWVSPMRVLHRPERLIPALRDRTHLSTLAFTSRHGVHAFAAALASEGLDGRALAGLRLAALEGGTERALLETLRLRADVCAAGGGRELAAALRDAGERGPVLLARAEGGRDEFPQTLREAAIPVAVVDCYATEIDHPALAEAARVHRDRPFDAIAFGSPRGAGALLDHLAQLGVPLGEARVGAIGHTTAEALTARGIPVHVIAPTPSFYGLVDRLAEALAPRPRMG